MPYKNKTDRNAYVRVWRKKNPSRDETARIRERLKLKLDVFSHYSNDKFICARCGFDDIKALSIDHTNGDRSVDGKITGARLYRRLRQGGYPEGYQVLCMNCQTIKRYENKEYN